MDIITCVFNWCYACEYEHAAGVDIVPCELMQARIELVVMWITTLYILYCIYCWDCVQGCVDND